MVVRHDIKAHATYKTKKDFTKCAFTRGDEIHWFSNPSEGINEMSIVTYSKGDGI